MDKYAVFKKVVGRIRSFSKSCSSRLDDRFNHLMSRMNAHLLIRNHVKVNGNRVVDHRMKKRLKKYSQYRFGSSGYWPWLSYYTEVRGEFKKGWIPYDYYRFRLLPKWNPEPRLSVMKTFDHRLFTGFSIEPLFIKISEQVYDPEMNQVTISEIVTFFKNYDQEVVLKFDRGGGGKYVKFILSKNIDEDFLKNYTGNFLIQPVINQHKNLAKLYPHSVNTLRVTTFIDEENETSILFTMLRVGVNGSRVDNLAAGGRLLMIDENGDVTPTAFDEKGFNMGDRHPDTGFLYKDLEIPSFNKAIENCIQSHNEYPYQRLISWDVCIDKQGEPKLIEWNSGCPYVIVPEAIAGPLWADEI